MLRYDFLNMMRPAVGSDGVSPEELSALAGRLAEARTALKERRADKSLGFFDTPKTKPSRAEMERLLKNLPKEVDTLVVIGIGGSNLGAQALEAALIGTDTPLRFRKPLRLVWAGDATDPQAVKDVLEGVNWKTTALNVISKSGDTIEPMSVFTLLAETLKKAVGKAEAAKRVIATTDARKGTLREIADREGYATLPVPGNVGGRFSVFTEVGAFPALAAGIDVDKLWKAAAAETELFFKTPPLKNPALLYAGLQHLLYKKGKAISIFMPYAKRLALVGAWYRQLWAESLGKRTDRTRSTVNVGPTPVAAVGPADQHSQIQLYVEGPKDKVVTFLEVAKFDDDFRLPTPHPDIEGVAYFGGLSMSEIVRAERAATAEALTASRRPNGTFLLPDLSAASVGAFLQMMMCATAAAGELYNIDAFDQPGVEAGKQAMYRMLGRNKN